MTNNLVSSALAKGVIWNFVGQGLPLVVALLAVPVLMHGYGTERFGFLLLVFALVGYFGILDLGLSRALTHWLASEDDRPDAGDAGATIWTAIALLGALGVVGGLALAAATPWLVGTALNMSDRLVDEARVSLLIVSASVPLLTCTQALRGVLEGSFRFAIVNAVRVPLSILVFLAPLLLLPVSNSLTPAVSAIVLCRVAGGAIYLRYCLILRPELRKSARLHLGQVLPLLRFGGWMSVSNVLGPLMVYLDRFLIGALISVTATAYYAAPYDLVTRLWIVPSAFCTVLFPAFAASAVSDPQRVIRLCSNGMKYTFITLYPLVLAIAVFAPDLLGLWLGPEFARESAGVLRILALGVLVNGLAHVPFAVVQGLGRADITAKFHLLELPFYILLLWWCVAQFGIVGAAAAWTIRVLVDAVLLSIAVVRLTGCSPKPMIVAGLAVSLGGALAGAIAFAEGSESRIALVALVLSVFLTLSWAFALSTEDRRFLTFQRVSE